MKRGLKRIAMIVVIAGLANSTVFGAELPRLGKNEKVEQASDAKVIKINNKASQDKIHVIIDGKDVTRNISNDQKPIITKNGVTYFCLELIEKFMPGISASYDDNSKLVTIIKNNHPLYFMVGKPALYVKTKEEAARYSGDDEWIPIVVGNNQYLSLRFLVDGFGGKVKYDATAKVISITSDGSEPIIPEILEENTEINLETLDPEQYTQLIIYMMLKGNDGGLAKKYGWSDDIASEIEEVGREFRNSMIEAEKQEFLQVVGNTITEKQAEEIATAIVDSLSRVKVEVSLVNKRDNTAKVRVLINYINLEHFQEKIYSKLRSNITGDQIIKAIVKTINEAEVSKGKNAIIVDYIFEDGEWQIKNQDETIEKIFSKSIKIS